MPRHSSCLTTRLGAIALALAASQAGATTYSVPLQFTLSLTAPVCSLTVGGVTADATTPTPATGVTVDLTPTPLAVISSPNTIIANIPGTSVHPGNGPGLEATGLSNGRRILNLPPSASATCTAGTPMTARISKASNATSTVGIDANYMAGTPGAGQSGTLPIGMLMGISSFAGVTGPVSSGGSAVTYGNNQPSVAATANGSAQPLALTVGIYSNSTTPLTASYAGLWTYSFNVNLDF